VTPEEMFALYEDGMTVRAIAALAKVSHVTVWKKLRAKGVSFRNGHAALRNSYGYGPNCKESQLRQEAFNLLRKHYTLEQIGTIMRANEHRVAKMLEASERGKR
jgi:hypothetical protein